SYLAAGQVAIEREQTEASSSGLRAAGVHFQMRESPSDVLYSMAAAHPTMQFFLRRRFQTWTHELGSSPDS
ncbi:MAG: hypothetical protein OEM97_01210, partial [Acidimicrobiia bacterium]|nr:hypothetical protein [Acidimicrobiia bacterium]